MKRMPRWVPILGKTGAALLLFAVLYLGLVTAAATIPVRGAPLLVRLYQGRIPGRGTTLARFRDADEHDPVEVLAIGPSHANLGVSSPVFAEEGIPFFNLGSSAQDPVISYQVLRRYLPRLKPRLVLLEVYWDFLREEESGGYGYESYLDLVSNMTWSPEMDQMAWDVGRVEAFNLGLAKHFGALDLRGVQPQPNPDQVYLPGGSSEYTAPHTKEMPPVKQPAYLPLNPGRLKLVERIIRLVRDHGGEVVLFLQPFPKEHELSYANAAEIQKLLGDFAKQQHVLYLEFQGKLPLDTNRHYWDRHHLNAEGAHLFTRALIATLRERRVLPEHSVSAVNIR